MICRIKQLTPAVLGLNVGLKFKFAALHSLVQCLCMNGKTSQFSKF